MITINPFMIVMFMFLVLIIGGLLGAVLSLYIFHERIHQNSMDELPVNIDGVYYYFVRSDYYTQLKISESRATARFAPLDLVRERNG